jgi:hypothetical protein
MTWGLEERASDEVLKSKVMPCRRDGQAESKDSNMETDFDAKSASVGRSRDFGWSRGCTQTGMSSICSGVSMHRLIVPLIPSD